MIFYIAMIVLKHKRMKQTVTLLCAALLLLPLACTREDILAGADDTIVEETTLTDPELSWSDSSCEATIGAANTFPTLSNEFGVTVTYTSSDTDVATIDADGAITLITAGTTAITASSAATDKYSASSASYALTVNKSEDGISWSAAACTVTYGDESTYSFPTLSNPGGQSVSYSSSNESVATISEDGTVTIVAQGETTITASAKANDAYEASSASYTLTVEGNLKSAGIYWSSDSYTATLASGDNSFPTLTNLNGLAVSYSSSDENVATVDSQGNVTLVAVGTVAIIATTEADDTYAAGSASYTLKVVKHDVSLSWSASACSQVLEEEDASAYPTLYADPEGLDITYASSNTSVATIDGSGRITLAAPGSTTISATFPGDDTYKAASASYTLTVSSTADDGAVTTTFASSGDSSSDDDISGTVFTRLVTINFSSGGAAVTGYTAVADLMSVGISGNQVTITYTGTENVVYKLSGTASDGFFKLYSKKKQALWLSGVSITNSSGAAINNQSGKRTFVYVEGTNTLADGASAAYSTSGDEDMKGVFFSEGQLIFSGKGSLTVKANNKKEKSGIVSDDYIRMMASPTVTVTTGSSSGHGLKANDYVQLSDGTLGITSTAAMKKGITSDNYVLVEGGATTINVSGGVAKDSEDNEYKGSAGIKADNYFAMTGGSVTIKNTGTGGKGIRAGSDDYDGDIADSYISGGTLNISTTGSESNDVSSKGMKIGWVTKSGNKVTAYAGNLNISGGTVIVSSSKSEGIEAKGNIVISGSAQVYVTSTGDDAINSQAEFDVTGGYLYAYSSANDAMDANRDLKISGGYVFAVTTKGAPEVAIDANTEENYKLYITGGVVVAYGGLESGYSSSNTVYSMSCSAGNWNALHNGNSYIAAFKAPSGVSSVAVCAPSLSKGYTGVSVGSTTYANGIWATSGISGGSAVSLSTYSGGGGGPGGGGGNPPGGGGWH